MIYNRRELQDNLNVLSKAYSIKPNMPIYQFVKFDDDKLIMSDGYISISCNFKSDIKALLPFKQLFDIVNKLTSQTIELIIDTNNVILKSDKSKFTLNTGNYSDYPDLRKIDNANRLTIKSNDFLKAIIDVSFCCSKDIKRPILTGVNFSENSIIATDSYRLAFNDTNLGLNCTISNRDLENLLNILGNNIDIKITNNDNLANFEFGNITYQTRLLNGVYPNTVSLIKKAYSIKLLVNKYDLVQALEMANLVNDNHRIAILDINENSLIVKNHKSQSGKYEEEISCKSDEKLSVCCNSDYLIETLKKVQNDTIAINFINDTSPFKIENNGNIYILCPVRKE